MSTSQHGRVRGRSLPLADWPAADRLAWRAALQPADIFDAAPRPATRWRPSTRLLIERGYGRWLTWLDGQGLLGPDATPASRATRDQVAAYATDLATMGSDYTVVARVNQLGDAMRAMAPEGDWGWILRGSQRMAAKAVPVRDKRGRMQSPHDLLALGLLLMDRADTDVHATAVQRAKLHRDGLMIALLALRPIRGGNLGAITLDRHLVQHGAGWALRFGPEETKQGRRLEVSWPDELAPRLARYLGEHRPLLLSCTRKALPPTSRLWVSAHGTPMTYSAIALQVKARTQAVFGAPVNPHLFRDCAATAIATWAPEQTSDVALVLGHKRMNTSERHYNHATNLSANGWHQDIVEDILQRAKDTGRKRGRGV